MDINAVVTAISAVGFPIVCAIAMAWYVKYTTDKHREEITKLNTEHKQEMTEITKAINNNTLVIQKLCDKLDVSRETFSVK